MAIKFKLNNYMKCMYQSPYEILFSAKPNYCHLRVFGRLCYASILPRSKDKFYERAIPCVFLGYPYGYKGYKLYNLQTHQTFILRDIAFHEHIFPFKHVSHSYSFLSTTFSNTPIPLPILDEGTSSPDLVLPSPHNPQEAPTSDLPISNDQPIEPEPTIDILPSSTIPTAT